MTMNYPGLEKLLKKLSDEALVEEALENIRKDFNLTANEEAGVKQIMLGILKSNFTDFSSLRAGVGTASTYHQWIDLGLDIFIIYRHGFAGAQLGSQLSTASSMMWTVGQWLGVIGPFLQFAGFVVALDEAMSVNVRIYKAIAVSYTITAWAYGDTMPTKSQKFLDAEKGWVGGVFSTDPEQLHDGWKEAQKETKETLRKSVQKKATELKIPQSRAEFAIKRSMQSANKNVICKAILKSLAAQHKNRGDVNEANTIGNHAERLVYPN